METKKEEEFVNVSIKRSTWQILSIIKTLENFENFNELIKDMLKVYLKQKDFDNSSILMYLLKNDKQIEQKVK